MKKGLKLYSMYSSMIFFVCLKKKKSKVETFLKKQKKEKSLQ